MKFNSIAIAAVLAVSAIGASAKTVAWGVHDDVQFGSNEFALTYTKSISFKDYYTFSLDTPSTLTDVAFDFEFGKSTNIKNGDIALYSGDKNGAYTFVSDFKFDGIQGTKYSFSNLAAGDYFFTVSGKANGVLGGAYAFTSSRFSSAVPEASSLSLMLAGLGVMGFVARRRRLGGRA